MLGQESLLGVEATIADNDIELQAAIAQATGVREQLVDAKLAVGEAQAAIKAAEQQLKDAQSQVRNLERKEQDAEGVVETAATKVAKSIASNRQLDVATRALYTWVYNERTLAWEEEPGAYERAAARGRVALTSLTERLQPEQPILYFEGNQVMADSATKKSLVINPPKLASKPRLHDPFETQGDVVLSLPNAASARATDQELVVVGQRSVENVLLSSYYGHNLDRLEWAASNEKWLIVGSEAIVNKLEQLDPLKRFMALTALAAANVSIPVVVDKELHQRTETKLVGLLAHLASGAAPDTITRREIVRDPWLRTGYKTVEDKGPIAQMAHSVDPQSLRCMAQALKLTKDYLREQTVTLLKDRVKKDTTSLEQVAKDLQSMNTLDGLLDTIFTP
jgi:hypothetical protein